MSQSATDGGNSLHGQGDRHGHHLEQRRAQTRTAEDTPRPTANHRVRPGTPATRRQRGPDSNRPVRGHRRPHRTVRGRSGTSNPQGLPLRLASVPALVPHAITVPAARSSPDGPGVSEDQAAAGYAVATIQRRLVTIRQVHRQHGITSPTDAPEVAATWTAARRRLGTAPRQVAPITIELLRRLVANCATTIAGHRDRALLVVGFAGALRRSEIAALTVNDVERQPDGLIITLRTSKSDQQRAGQRLGLPHGSRPDTCPVRSLTAWQHTADLQHGALFRPVDRHGNIADRHLSGRAVAEIIKRRVQAIGLDPARYSGHSLRAGFATSAAAAGATEIAIARQTRHRSMTVLRGYIREGNLFRTNAATTIGL